MGILHTTWWPDWSHPLPQTNHIGGAHDGLEVVHDDYSNGGDCPDAEDGVAPLGMEGGSGSDDVVVKVAAVGDAEAATEAEGNEEEDDGESIRQKRSHFHY